MTIHSTTPSPLSSLPNPRPPPPPPPSPMDPPPLPSSTNTTVTVTNPLPDTLDSSPSQPKLRLMCSYGGQILLRPHDKTLTYVGGETRIIHFDRSISLSSLSTRLSSTLFNHAPFTLKYQLPTEDLDSLISVTTDEDLDNLIDEYDRLNAVKSRLRLFLFPLNPDNPLKTWSSFSESASVNSLLGLDGDGNGNGNGEISVKGGGQDAHSVPDSPLLETAYSSFGSTTSSKVNLEGAAAAGGGGVGGGASRGVSQVVAIEGQFGQMGIGGVGGGGQNQDDGFMVMASQPAFTTAGVALGGADAMGENQNRIVSDDERSEQGAPVGYRKPLQPQMQIHVVASQLQQKSSGGLPSPDSISSDGSLSNSISRPNPAIYQDQVLQMQSGTSMISSNPVDAKINVSESIPKVQMQQQIQHPGYILQYQYDQQQTPAQQLHFIHDGAHYISHHPAGAVPVSGYYPGYPLQQQHPSQHHLQLDHQSAVYYVSARQPQYYNNMPVQQSSFGETTSNIPSSRSQAPPNLAMGHPPAAAYNPMRNAPISKPEMAASGMYRQETSSAGMYRQETSSASPQFVQVAPNQNQQQYIGYSQVIPSQSAVRTSAGSANYGYEYADPARAQVYYTHKVPSQYQTMAAAAAGVMLAEGSAQLPNDNIK